MKPRQTRGIDTHFHSYDPWLWSSPGISLFLQSLGPHSPLGTLVRLHPGCTCFFSAKLCPFNRRHSWQVPPGALHTTAGLCRLLGRRLPISAGYQLWPRGSAAASHWRSHSDSPIAISWL